ncbi:MAG: hypothetical protein ABIS20_11970 [Thermoanaerobaculia bacterium]
MFQAVQDRDIEIAIGTEEPVEGTAVEEYRHDSLLIPTLRDTLNDRGDLLASPGDGAFGGIHEVDYRL